MKLRKSLLKASVLLLCAIQVPAEARGPSTPEERAKVVAVTRLLERDPFVENAPANRQWLRDWIVEVPDIRVYVCDALLSHDLGETYPYSREVGAQPMISAAAFAIEHQDKSRDEIAQYNAGIEGALRVYEALLKAMPDARSELLDELVAKRERGELAQHIARQANEKCKRANTDVIASLVGAAVALVLGLLVARWYPAGQPNAWIAKNSRRIVFACVAYFLIVVSALHVLEPEFDPRYRFISEYVWGDYGWLMTTNFFALGLAAFIVAAGLRGAHQTPWSARLGFGLLMVGAFSVCLAGVFKDFMPHLAASAVAIPSIILATLLLSWSFRRAGEWHAIHRATLLIALGMLAAFALINMHFGAPGLLQRAFIFLLLLWLSIVMQRLVRVTVAQPTNQPVAVELNGHSDRSGSGKE